MKHDKHTEYVVRDSIEKLLSESELANVSNVETAGPLAHGDEYIDLEHLDQGVRTAPAKTAPNGRMLTRKAVHRDTWNKIVAALAGG